MTHRTVLVSKATTGNKGHLPLVPLALAVAVVATALVWHAISSDADSEPLPAASSTLEQLASNAALPLTVSRLETRLVSTPTDVQGWLLLARSRLQLGRVHEGIDAYRRALALKGDQPDALAELADALAFADAQHFGPEAEALLNAALRIDPRHLTALSLAGLAAFDRGDFKAATDHWSHYLDLAPSSPLAEQIKRGLSRAQASLSPHPLHTD